MQPVGVAAGLDDQPELVGVAGGPAGEGAVLGPGGPQLGDAADQLEQEADDRALDLADLGLLAELAGQQDQDHQQHDPQQDHADQGQPPAIPEQQSQVEQRDQPGDQGRDDRAGDLLEDQAQAHGPEGQVARGETAEEPGGQPEQAIPDRGDDGRHDLALDAQQGQSLDDLEDRVETASAARNRQKIRKRGRARSPGRSTSGMT